MMRLIYYKEIILSLLALVYIPNKVFASDRCNIYLSSDVKEHRQIVDRKHKRIDEIISTDEDIYFALVRGIENAGLSIVGTPDDAGLEVVDYKVSYKTHKHSRYSSIYEKFSFYGNAFLKIKNLKTQKEIILKHDKKMLFFKGHHHVIPTQAQAVYYIAKRLKNLKCEQKKQKEKTPIYLYRLNLLYDFFFK